MSLASVGMRPDTGPFVSGPSNRSIPSATVIPVLQYPDARAAAEWLCRAFGFRERLRIGSHRIQLQVGDGAVVVAQGPPSAPGAEVAGHSVMVRVSNADRHFETAKRAGATVIREPASHPYGERQYSVVDPGGHAWTFSQSEANIDPSAWGGELVQSGSEVS